MKNLEIFVYVVCISLILRGGITPEFQTQFRTLCEFIVYAWSLGVVNLVFCGGALNKLGVRPRTPLGLVCILPSPLIHGSWKHLAGNTVPFFILGWFVMLGGIREFFIVTAFIPLFSGLGIWLFGQPQTSHVGASDVILGYLGFLLVRSYFTHDSLSIVLTALIGIMYGGSLLRNLLPEKGVSREGHFFGFIGGILAAQFLDPLKLILPALYSGF
jgi:membrane associated rhomboid family serine protease